MGALDETFGALFIATSIGLILYGMTTLQTFFYFSQYYNDPAKTKLLVTFVWLLDSLNTAFTVHYNYFYLVSSVGYPQQLLDGTWSFFIAGAVNFLVTFVVKSFYVIQIRQLCSMPWKQWLPPVIMLLIFTEFAFGMEFTALYFSKIKFALLEDVLKWRVITLCVINLVSDAAIVLALCLPLRNRRSEIPQTGIDTVIFRIMVFCTQRFILCLVFGVIELTVYLRLPQTMYAAASEIIYKKLYVNCLLAVLNSRRYLRGIVTEGSPSTQDTVTEYPLDNTRPLHTFITSLFQSTNHVNTSVDDDGAFALRTCDLEESVISSKK